jgi:hypothetical protein
MKPNDFYQMKKYIIFLLIAFTLASCGPGKYMTSEISRYDISKVTIFEPVTYISYIEAGKMNRMEYSDSLTYMASYNLLTGVSEYLSDYYLVDLLYLDSTSRELVFHQIDQMMGYAGSSYEVEEIPFPPSLDSLMWINNIDYGVCILHTGFARQKKNYRRQLALRVLMEVFADVAVYPTRAVSELRIVILDRKNQKVAFYNSHVGDDHDPYFKPVTDQQIQRIFRKFFKQ